MTTPLTIRRGQEEFHIGYSVEDCANADDPNPTALDLHDRTSAYYFIRSLVYDSGHQHDLRLFLLDHNSSFLMHGIDDDSMLVHAAEMLASGQIVIAGKKDSAGGTPTQGAMRKEGGSGKAAGRNAAQPTPLQDEMAAQQQTPADAAQSSETTQDNQQQDADTTWIEIELLDDSGNPVPYERYKVVMPDGSVKYGHLDGNAKAKIEKLQPGNCQVSFPDRDQELWDTGQS